MSIEENKALVLRFYEELWNEGNVDVADELIGISDGRYDHGGRGALSPESQKKVTDGFRALFPDNEFTVEVLLAEGDRVAACWRMKGTHRQSGTRIENYTGVNVFRIRDGKIVELRNNRDDLGLFQQLGYVPSASELRKRAKEEGFL